MHVARSIIDAWSRKMMLAFSSKMCVLNVITSKKEAFQIELWCARPGSKLLNHNPNTLKRGNSSNSSVSALRNVRSRALIMYDEKSVYFSKCWAWRCL